MLFKIYVRSELSTKRIIQQERMTQESFDWLVGEVKSRFEQSLVHPGEMIGSIAAHSIGEPAT
jgi:DNA-directed RNA polymerase II subunit RPB1